MNPLKLLTDFLLPPSCHLCGNRLSEGERYICTGCLSHLPRTNYHRRYPNGMERRFEGIVNYGKVASLMFYSPRSDVARLIGDMKYNRFRGLAVYMGEVTARELYSTGFFSDIDVIVPIPMHFLKQAFRGYNQVAEFAKGLSDMTGLPVDCSLKAIKPHRTQTSVSHSERIDNIKGVFSLRDSTTLRGKHILLVDDVCTTGSTLIEAASAISDKLPDATISILTLGVTF